MQPAIVPTPALVKSGRALAVRSPAGRRHCVRARLDGLFIVLLRASAARARKRRRGRSRVAVVRVVARALRHEDGDHNAVVKASAAARSGVIAVQTGVL